MERKNFINFIPRPENKDVILYDTSLTGLIDVNVLEEYNKLYPIFESKKNQYNELKLKIEEYQKSINNIYLFNKSWSEEDYLQKLQNDKKLYSTLFGDIKKIENNISMLQRNLNSINEKIEIQKAKDTKKIQDRNENVDKNIIKNKETLLNLQNLLDAYKFALEQIDDQLKNNEEEFQKLNEMTSRLNEGKCKCEFCGRVIKTVDEDSMFYNRMCKNMEKNKHKLEVLLSKKQKLETNITNYKIEIKNIRDTLSNDIQFKKDSYNFYQKKSIEMLKLESSKDNMLNNIAQLEKQLKNNSKTNTKKYTELKDNIEKYELSLNNLKKSKELKNTFSVEIVQFNNLKTELKEILAKLEEYIKFINLYYKIIEQKANEYCGNDYKFKFFKIENYKLCPILEIYYKDTEISQLDIKTRDEVEKYLSEKFSIYY
jgi:chromosome segregation ATPase